MVLSTEATENFFMYVICKDYNIRKKTLDAISEFCKRKIGKYLSHYMYCTMAENPEISFLFLPCLMIPCNFTVLFFRFDFHHIYIVYIFISFQTWALAFILNVYLLANVIIKLKKAQSGSCQIRRIIWESNGTATRGYDGRLRPNL